VRAIAVPPKRKCRHSLGERQAAVISEHGFPCRESVRARRARDLGVGPSPDLSREADPHDRRLPARRRHRHRRTNGGAEAGETLGQSVLVENRGGASGNIGTELAARAAPDGYTILMGNVAPNAINVSLFKNLPFDPVADFVPVSLVASTPNILVVHPSTPARTVKEVIALAKAKPGTLNFASAGVGSSSHLAGELFRILAGADIVHVPYKGAGPAIVDVLSGQVQLYFATMPAAMPHVKSGKLAPVAVTSSRRSQALPDLPTIAEAGVPGYEASTWYGVLAPAHTPAAVIARLHENIVKILAVPETRARLADQASNRSATRRRNSAPI